MSPFKVFGLKETQNRPTRFFKIMHVIFPIFCTKYSRIKTLNWLQWFSLEKPLYWVSGPVPKTSFLSFTTNRYIEFLAWSYNSVKAQKWVKLFWKINILGFSGQKGRQIGAKWRFWISWQIKARYISKYFA